MTTRPGLLPMTAKVLLCLGAGAVAVAHVLGCSQPVQRTSSFIAWAIGPEHRGTEPRPGDRYLLVIPAKRPADEGRPVLPGCFPATAFLPTPAPDPRIFFLRDGQVYVGTAGGQGPVPLLGNDPALRVTRLLAFQRHTSPLGLLVAARAADEPEEVWLLIVEDRAIQSRRRIKEQSNQTTQQAFFDEYDVPRCLSGGAQCLIPGVDGDTSYLDVEPVRGQPPVPFQELAGIEVVDAMWASSDGGAIYLFVPCPGAGD